MTQKFSTCLEAPPQIKVLFLKYLNLFCSFPHVILLKKKNLKEIYFQVLFPF